MELFFSYAQTRTEEFVFLSHEKRQLRLLEEHPKIVEHIPAYHISFFRYNKSIVEQDKKTHKKIVKLLNI